MERKERRKRSGEGSSGKINSVSGPTVMRHRMSAIHAIWQSASKDWAPPPGNQRLEQGGSGRILVGCSERHAWPVLDGSLEAILYSAQAATASTQWVGCPGGSSS